MGKVFENLTDEELCDLMCGGPEDDFDSELIYCKNCIHAKPKQGLSIQYCGKHHKYVTEHTVNNRACKDYTEKDR